MTPQLYDIPLPDGTTVKSAMSPAELGLGGPPPGLPGAIPPPDMGGAPPPAAGKLAANSPLVMGVEPVGGPATPSSPLLMKPEPMSPSAPPMFQPAGGVDPSLKVDSPERKPAPPTPGSDLVRVGPSRGGIAAPGQDPTARDANEYAEYLMRGSPSRGGRAVKLPEHDALRSFQIERGPQMSDDDMQAQQDADIDRRLAGQGVADAEKARLQGEVTAAAQRNLADEAALIEDRANMEAKEADIQSSIDAKVKQRDEELDAIRGMKVDPNRFFADRGAVGGILGVLAMALGGAQSGLTGGPNWAAQEINKMVDRDIDAQAMAIANAKDMAEATKTDLGRLYAQHGDLDLAKAELRQRQHAVAEAMAANYAKKAGIPEVDARYQQWLADDSAAAAKRDADYRMAAQGSRREMWEHVPERTAYVGGSGGRKPLSPEEAYRRAAEFAKNKRAIDAGPDGGKAPEMAQYRVRDSKGEYFYMPEKDAQATQDYLRQKEAYSRLGKRQLELLDKKEKDGWTTEERAEYETNMRSMTTDVTKMKGLGAPSGSDIELAERGRAALPGLSPSALAKNALKGDLKGTRQARAAIKASIEDFEKRADERVRAGFKDPRMVGEAAANPIPSARSEE